MANEYFKRTNTNAANQQAFTYSFWMKGNDPDTSSQARPIYNYDGTNLFQFFVERSSNNNPGFWVLYGSGVDLRWEGKRFDPSAWYHIILSVNTTRTQDVDRAILYVNGVRISALGSQTGSPGTPDFPDLNDKMYHGINYINGIAGNSKYQLFDYYYVDGQALKPDVFGFFKDGDGYQSVGTTTVTDFRSGQWSPRLPKSIKHTINRGGGFGSNGFYLPMNDSSNFGADFHCNPDSIIVLKGEDEPQPRNGAPTTSDAFVSQLRSDPFSANLELAVAGISTTTGSNLITNGDFDTDISSWSASGVQFTHTTNSVGGNRSGKLMYFATGTNITRNIYQNVTTETGKRYTLSFDASSDTANANTVKVNGTNYVTVIDNNNNRLEHHNVSFTASGTSTEIKIESTVSNRAYFDNFVVKQEDLPRDYSADIKGSGSNTTLSANGNTGVGYEIPSYYGSAINFDGSDVKLIFDGAVSNPGTGDFTFEFWLAPDDFDSNSYTGLLTLTCPTGVKRFETVIHNSTIQVYTDTGNWRNTGFELPTEQWTHLAFERCDGYLNMYVNGVVKWSVENTRNYDEAWSTKQQFGKHASSYGNFDGLLQDLRCYVGVAKYKGGFDVSKPTCPKYIESFRATADTSKNNFATLNPLAAQGTHTNGNLTAAPATNVAYSGAISNFMVNSGKWYCELRCDENSTGGIITGISELENLGFRDIFGGSNFFGQSIETNDTAGVRSAVGGADGDIISMYMDLDSSPITCSFAVNGGSATTYNSGSLSYNYNNLIPGKTYGFVAADAQSGVVGIQFTFNFGQNPTFCGQTTAGTNTDGNGKGLFKYAPPTGFLALCDDNLPTPAIADPGEHFKCVLWTGDGSTGRSITGVGFQPGLVWIKSRSFANNHHLFDVIRGPNTILRSSSMDSESNPGQVMPSFDSDGFTVGEDGGNNATNDDGNTFVGWCWKAGGAPVSNGNGTITSQVSANQTAGFSIVSYTGNSTDNATVGHGLLKVPDMIIVKNRDLGVAWGIWHSSMATGEVLRFSTTLAQVPGTAYFQDENNTSSVFALGTNDETNFNDNYIAYCWHAVDGYSKFGSYTGNNSTNGPFVYCGFKPAWLIVKCRTANNGNWVIYDSSRSSRNVNGLRLGANLSDSENQDNTNLGNNSSEGVDFLSNGFKIRTTGPNHNLDGEEYIYAAFAESPFQTSNAK